MYADAVPRAHLTSYGVAVSLSKPVWGLSTLVLVACSGPDERTADARPDIFLLTVDTLRADHLPMYGYERQTAPWLSTLADKGIVFEQVESSSSWTVPGVASFLTGMMPHQLGIYDPPNEPRPTAKSFRIPDTARSIAERLRDEGYRTYGVTANAHLVEEMGYHQGFDTYHNVGWWQAAKVDDALQPLIPEIRDRTEPVFVWIHLFDPHDPYMVRTPWVEEWAVRNADLEKLGISGMVELQNRADLTRGSPQLQRVTALYDGEIAYSDDWMRKFAGALEIDDGDLVVFTSDHGEEFRDHGHLGHRYSLYEETVRVPLVISWPDQLAARRVEDRVSIVDIPATIAEVAGAEIGPYSGMSQRSLLPLARGESRPKGPSVVADLTRRNGPRLRSIYRDDLKLIVVETEPEKVQLYDLAADPGERANLAEARPELVEDLRTTMRRQFDAAPELEPQLMEGEHSQEMIEQLKAMGYIDEDEGTEEDEP